ncbi:MAG: translocation/assembly module TamB domain-containing protein [Desulfatibacillaceae bacterium]
MTEESTEKRKEPRRLFKALKALLAILAVMFAAGLLVVALLPVIIGLGPVQDRIRSVVRDQAAANTPFEVAVDRVSLRGYTHLEVLGISVRDDTGPVLEVERVLAGSVWSLLIRQDRLLEEVLVERPEFWVSREPDGTWNMQRWEFGRSGEAEPEKAESDDGGELPVTIESIRVRDGVVHASVARAGHPEWREDFSLVFGVGLYPEEARVREFALAGAGVGLTVSGTAGVAAPHPLDISVKAGAEDLTRFATVAPGIPGLVDVMLTVEAGGEALSPTVRLTAGAAPAQKVRGTIHLNARDGISARAMLAFASIDPGAFVRGMSADVNGAVAATGKYADGAFEATANLRLENSRVNEVEMARALLEARAEGATGEGGAIDATASGFVETLTAAGGSVRRVDMTARAVARPGTATTVRAVAEARVLTAVYQTHEVAGVDIKASGEISLGEDMDLAAETVISARDAVSGESGARALTLTANAGGWPSLSSSFRTNGTLLVEGATAEGRSVTRAHLVFTHAGTKIDSLALTANAEGAVLSLAGSGGIAGFADNQYPVDIALSGAVKSLDPSRFAQGRNLSGNLSGSFDATAKKEAGAGLDELSAHAGVRLDKGRAGPVRLAGGDMAARYADNAVVLENADIRWDQGRLTAKGRMTTRGQGSVDVTLAAQDLSGPTAWFLENPFPGSLDLTATAEGDFLSKNIRGSADVEASLPDLAAASSNFLPDPVRGKATLTARAEVSGDPAQPRISGDLSGSELGYQGNSIANLEARFSGRPADLAGSVDLVAETVNAGGMDLTRAALVAEADRSSARFSLEASGPEAPDLVAEGSAAGLDSGKKVFSMPALRLRYQGRKMENKGPVKVILEGNAVRVEQLTLTGNAGEIRAAGDFVPEGESDLEITAKNVDLAFPSSFLRPGKPLSGMAAFTARISGTPSAPRITMEMEARDVAADEDLPTATVSFSADYENGRAGAGGKITSSAGGYVNYTATMPVDLSLPLAEGWLPESGLDASFDGYDLALDFLPGFVPRLARLDAVLRIDATATGNPGSPELNGTVSVRALEAKLADWERPFRDIGIHVRFDPEAFHLEKFVAATEKKGILRATGTVRHDDFAPVEADLSVTGEDFYVEFADQAHVRVGADLSVAGMWPDMDVGGEIVVGEGEIRLDRFLEAQERAIFLSEDIRFQDTAELEAEDTPEIAEQLELETDVRIQGPFWIRGAGAQIELAGEIAARKERGEENVRLFGKVNVVRGYYTFQGRTFNVVEGSINFIGLSPPAPNIDIRTRYSPPGDTVVFLDIGGHPERVTLELSSDPAMDQTDILSVLLFGKPAGELGSGQSRTLQERAVGVLGNQVFAELKRKLGADVPVDLLTVEKGGAEDDNTLVVGKYLSPRLFVIYKRGISTEGENVVQLEYELTDQFSLESQVGDRRAGADIFWSLDY